MYVMSYQNICDKIVYIWIILFINLICKIYVITMLSFWVIFKSPCPTILGSKMLWKHKTPDYFVYIQTPGASQPKSVVACSKMKIRKDPYNMGHNIIMMILCGLSSRIYLPSRTMLGDPRPLGEGRFYGHEGVMILVADDIFMKMSFPYV